MCESDLHTNAFVLIVSIFIEVLDYGHLAMDGRGAVIKMSHVCDFLVLGCPSCSAQTILFIFFKRWGSQSGWYIFFKCIYTDSSEVLDPISVIIFKFDAIYVLAITVP